MRTWGGSPGDETSQGQVTWITWIISPLLALNSRLVVYARGSAAKH